MKQIQGTSTSVSKQRTVSKSGFTPCILLFKEAFHGSQKEDLQMNLEKREFTKQDMENLGFDAGYGWWKPALSKMQLLEEMKEKKSP